jgi:hypothetical protein
MKKYIVIWLIVAILINMLLYINMSTANPAGWSADINLTPDDDKDSRHPSIGIFKDNIHVIWSDSRHYPVTNRAEIYYINSTDGGKTWNPEVRLTFFDSTKDYPRMAINGQNIHIVWTDDRDVGSTRIYYKNSTDGGNTWSADKRISPLSADASGQNPDIAIDGNKIHVVYPDADRLKYINSSDNGITWSEPQQLTPGPIRHAAHPSIAINGSNIHIIWRDHYNKSGAGTAGAIFYINSYDGGLSWYEEFNLTAMDLDASYSDIAVYGDNVHVTYCEERSGLWEIYYRRSDDNGITWTEEFTVSNSTENLSRSVIKVRENNVFALWSDEKDPIAEIYLRNSSDNGQNWDNEIRMTYDPAACYYQNIALDNESIHLIWSDWRDGAPEIYYKRYPFYPPPTNLTIDIQGTNLFLNWTPPKNSPSPVDHYHIYRSSTWDGFDFSVPWVNTSINPDPIDSMIIPLRTTWNDTFAFLDENNNYFYIVRAINNEGWNDTNMNIIGKYVISLEKGWNLISLPLAQKDSNISEVLKTINGQFNIVQWYEAKDGIWRSSSASLTNINRTMGLWIHMKNAQNLSIVGTLPESTDIALYEGWNLVGYPSLKTRNPNEALSGISWQAVQHYDAYDLNDPWKHNSTNKPDSLNDFKEMKRGYGYWVYVTINDTWVRTRTVENDKIVVWNVHGIEEKDADQHKYDSMFENPIEIEEEHDFKIDNIPEESTIKDKGNNFAISLIPLIILIAFIFVEIILLHKKRG